VLLVPNSVPPTLPLGKRNCAKFHAGGRSPVSPRGANIAMANGAILAPGRLLSQLALVDLFRSGLGPLLHFTLWNQASASVAFAFGPRILKNPLSKRKPRTCSYPSELGVSVLRCLRVTMLAAML
jgi:hypothetical protein